MALRYIDSFDHYVTADLSFKWFALGGAPAIGTGRYGSALVSNNTTGNVDYVEQVFDYQTTWVLGFAWKQDGAYSNQILCIRDGTTNQMRVNNNSDGTFSVLRNATTLATSAAAWTTSNWYYLEFKTTIGNAGSYELRLNGVTILSASGVDTQETANASANRILLGTISSPNSGATMYYDDLYVLDGQGSAPLNDFLGDCRVEAIVPNGNGNSSQFDGSDGNQTDNYLLVDEAAQDGDTTYVESGDAGDKDTYAYSNLVITGGTVHGVQINPLIKKTTAGSKVAASVARLSATEEDSANKIVLDGYKYNYDIRPTKPGGGAWTIADINSAEFGLKVVS